MIKVIAVDFGGVYFTWNIKKFVNQLSKFLGVGPVKVRKAVNQRIRDMTAGKITEKQYWHAFCRIIGKEVDHKRLRKITEAQFKPYKPVINLMKKLRRKYKIVLLTNQHALLDDLDKKYKFYKNFDVVLCSHVVKALKPQKKMYNLLMKRTKAKPEEIIFIDDYIKNVDGAKKLGINAILFKNMTQLKRELQKVI